LVVRRYFDTKNIHIYLTDSSAKLLSKKINTNLRGHSLSIEILPYSFQEYLTAHHSILEKRSFEQATFDTMHQQLLNFLPAAVQLMSKNEWRETLQGYINTVILIRYS